MQDLGHARHRGNKCFFLVRVNRALGAEDPDVLIGRLVPLEDDLARAIRERARELDSPWLFPSSHGSHLTEAHLGKLVARHLARDLTTHTLRHRCGTVAYAGTRDLRAVQELLGHAKPETTMLYTAIPDQDIRAAMLAAA